LVLFVTVIPLAFGISVAFTNYGRTAAAPPRILIQWTGLETFINIFKIKQISTTFVDLFWWNAAWAVLATSSSYAFGMLQAMLLRSKLVKFRVVFRQFYLLPWAVPGMVSILVFRVLLNREGAFNRLLIASGITTSPVPFLSNVAWARLCLVLVHVWLAFPYFMALISGIMTAISPELYEAAEIDGANSMQKFKSITFPIVITSTAPQIMMSLVGAFNSFGLVYFLTDGGPRNPAYNNAGSTDILITWIYRLGASGASSYACALSIFVFLIVGSISAWNLLHTRVFKED
jgi:arabinogalactan oligomer/maltooligosaccharide transport system permease protein